MRHKQDEPSFWLSDEQRQRWKDWYQQDGRAFEEAMGICRHPEVVLPLIARLARYIGGNFPMWKDDVDRARCDTLRAYMEGEAVPHEQLAIAIGLMMQAHGAAVERIWSLEQTLREIQKQRPPRGPVPRVPIIRR